MKHFSITSTITTPTFSIVDPQLAKRNVKSDGISDTLLSLDLTSITMSMTQLVIDTIVTLTLNTAAMDTAVLTQVTVSLYPNSYILN
jgi:hypothetical protein